MVRYLINPSRVWVICAASGLLFLTSCQKSVDFQGPDEAEINELKTFLAASSGYSTDRVSYSRSSNVFVIDKDVEMNFEEARAHYEASKHLPTSPNGRGTQMVYTYTVSKKKASQVKIYIEPSVPASWVTALEASVSNWNAAGSQLNLQLVNQSKRANISVGTIYMANSSTVANANYPDAGGNPGKKIIINTFHNGLAEEMKIFAITHELGHTFGFTHTDGFYGTLINGTPVSDPASIMNSYVQSWISFSNYDLLAIQTVYPQ